MRQRWFSRRALLLHLALIVWFPGCLIAGWWQVNRAFDGNGLSYLYSVEWPVFAVVGVWAWWALVHTDPDTVGQRAQQRMVLAGQLGQLGQPGQTTGADGPPAPAADPDSTSAASTARTTGAGPATVAPAPGDPFRPASPIGQPARHREDEDEALAAYNDRLAELASRGPQGWRKR